MKQMELPFMVEFKEGELVILLSKSAGDPLGQGFANNMYEGDIARIERVEISTEYRDNMYNLPPKGTKYYVVRGGLFLAEDLRRAPK